MPWHAHRSLAAPGSRLEEEELKVGVVDKLLRVEGGVGGVNSDCDGPVGLHPRGTALLPLGYGLS